MGGIQHKENYVNIFSMLYVFYRKQDVVFMTAKMYIIFRNICYISRTPGTEACLHPFYCIFHVDCKYEQEKFCKM